MKKQDIYNEDIHPLVERIALVCQQAEIPMFMTFEDSQNGFSTTCVNEDKSNFYKIKMHYWIHQTWSFDDLMKKVIEDARLNGHDSLYLKAMGIKEEPEN